MVLIPYIALFLLSKSVKAYDTCRRNTTGLKLIDNGYEDIIIWIGEEVQEDYTFIADLKKLMTETSAQLYQTTKQRAYFKTVSIVLPASWGHPPGEMHNEVHASTFPATESPSRAHFWIRNRSPRSVFEGVGSWSLGDQSAMVPPPYVIKTTPCGFPGKYVRLSAEYVRFGSKVKDVLGDPKKRLVREWAKLRWGVYDEVGAKSLNPGHFYLHTDLTIKPIACSLGIKGSIEDNPSAGSCNRNYLVNNPACSFKPNPTLDKYSPKPTNAFASLMYSSQLPYTNQFCDTDEESGASIPKEHLHNSEAPTVHNLHCNGRSIWQVMREHDDFIDGNNPPMSSPTPPPTKFKLIEKPDRRIVLVIDTSTSMGTRGRLELMRQAASHFFDIVPTNTFVGIVCFSTRAVIKEVLQEIKTNDVRSLMKRRIPRRLVTGTSIGSGIMAALKVLKSSGPKHMRSTGGSILVLTDGKEHNTPKINETFIAVRSYGCRVSTIAFGPSVAKDLEYLAEITGGSTYFASSGDFANNNELRESFTASIEGNDDSMVVVASDTLSVERNTTSEYNFFIDETIGTETRITVLYKDEIDPLIGIRNFEIDVWEVENEESFTAHNMTFFVRVEKEFFKKLIYIPDEMPPGSWTLMIKNRKAVSSLDVQISIISQARVVDDEKLTLSPALLCRTIDYTGVETVVIYAHVSIGERAVLSATVIAEVTRPLTTYGMVDTSSVQLFDTGFGADVIPDDGVYSGFFRAFTLKGRYSVKVYADNRHGIARVTRNNVLGIGVMDIEFPVVDTRYLIKNQSNVDNIVKNKRQKRSIFEGFLPKFQRTSSGGGSFIVQTWDPDTKICPPGYIHFQDSCYKIFRTQMVTYKAAKNMCAFDQGTLAYLDSYQEVKWVKDKVGKLVVWFGGVLQTLGLAEELEDHLHENQGFERDEDLWAISNLLNKTTNTPEKIDAWKTFQPDFDGISQKQMNSLERAFSSINQQGGAEPRKRRQASEEGSAGDDIGDGDTEINTVTSEDPSTTQSTIESIKETTSPTLSPARREPERPLPEESYIDTGCYWFQDGHVIKSDREICSTSKIFICEREKIDLTAPSKVVNLRSEVNLEQNVVNLTWPATGDDNMDGKVTKYEFRTLRTENALRQLYDDFEVGQIISSESFVGGMPTEYKNPTEIESVLIKLDAIAGCPMHAVIDLHIIVALKSLSSATEVNAIQQFVNEVTNQVYVGAFDVTISVIYVVDGKGSWHLRHATNKTEILKSLETRPRAENKQSEDIEDLFENLHKAGRKQVPKIALVIADNDELVLNYTIFTQANVMMISVGSITTMDLLYESVSNPPCKNAMLAENWEGLSRVATNVVQQLCYFRADEYQAIGLVAIDEVGNRSPPSTIVSVRIMNRQEEIICDPLPTLPPPLAVAGIPPAVIVTAVTVPIAAILSIVGGIILFGQLRKFKRNRERKKREKMEAEKEAARREKLKNDPRVQSIRQKMKNSPQKFRLQKNNKTAPSVSNPPV